MKATYTGQRGRVLVRRRLLQQAERHRNYLAHIPKWRHPLVGYLLTFPLVAISIGLVLLQRYLLVSLYFPSLTMLLSVLLVSLFWGVGPALLAVLLSTLSLDYFYIEPVGQFSAPTWNTLWQLLPFVVAGLVIAIITGQRELARQRALVTEQIANEHANELALANQELEEANRLKDQFISMASHELKTPITTIRGQAQIAQRRIKKQANSSPDLEFVQNSLNRIDEQTHRLANLVNDLLDLSSVRSGKLPLQVKSCDIGEICREVVDEQSLLSERQIELNLPATPIVLEADRNRLGQVITNLVGNAIKYSPAESPVKVALTRQGSRALISVQNFGPGISKEQQMHIFEPFYRTPDAQTSAKSGVGLGLAICKDIVERHGGHIWCESSPGAGTTFFVELPQRR